MTLQLLIYSIKKMFNVIHLEAFLTGLMKPVIYLNIIIKCQYVKLLLLHCPNFLLGHSIVKSINLFLFNFRILSMNHVTYKGKSLTF